MRNSTIASVMADLNVINAKYQGTRNTRERSRIPESAFGLRQNENFRLGKADRQFKETRAGLWSKGMAGIMNDKDHPPSEELKAEMLQVLQQVQGARCNVCRHWKQPSKKVFPLED